MLFSPTRQLASGFCLLVAACNVPGPAGDAVRLQNGAVRVVDQASLAGQTPCSEGRGGLDRWCVFFRQKQTTTYGQDLWAVDVSRILRGENLQCNQDGPGCVEILPGNHLVHWGFIADTLLIDGAPEGNSAVAQVFAPVSAWRPDWSAAVQVTSKPASACWTDEATESVACVEQGVQDADAAAAAGIDAGAVQPGAFYAGRLTADRRTLTLVPQGHDFAQAIAATDSMLVFLSPGVAQIELTSGTVNVLNTQVGSLFAVTPGQSWLLWMASQKSDLTGTHSLVAAPFPAGGARHVLLGNVLRHHFVEGPRATGADVLAVVAGSDGTNHLMLAGPDGSAAPIISDLGAWTGTTADKLDASSGNGFAVVADTQGTAVLGLLAPDTPCLLGTSVIPSSQVLLAPSLDGVLWVDAAAGTAGTGYRGQLSACAPPQAFATSAVGLQVVANRQLLFLDSAKYLLRLDLATAGATAVAMRDPDEVVYRWAYVDSADALVLDMTSVFDTSERLYVLRKAF